MKKLSIIAIVICLGITTNIFAQSNKGKPARVSDVYVTAEFQTFGAEGTFNKITMDTSMPYEHNKDGVSAQFFAGGSKDLVIQLLNSQRYAWFDLSEVADSTNQPNWISSPQLFQSHMNILEAYKAKETCNPTDGIYNCNFQTRMNAGYLKVSGMSKTTYALLWNPETTNNRPVNSPENTSFVNVNYYKGLDGQEVFTITPLPNCATRANNFTCEATDTQRVIADLEDTTGRKVSAAGQYVMPFTLI